MARTVMVTTALLAVLLSASTASAGIYADDLSKCLIKATSDSDQKVLIQWIFGVMATNPAVKPLSSITSEQHKDLNQKGAELMQRLMLSDCRKETIAAIKYEGPSTIEASFSILGQVAMRGLMSDPSTVAEMGRFASYYDKPKWTALLNEVGVAPQGAPTSTK